MADINITFAEVRNKAAQIRGLNNDLTSKLSDIQTEIKNLEADWTSDASVEIRSKITSLQSRFDEYNQIIEEYAKFLDDTANKYEQTEQTLTSNLNAFE
ncbi:MAG: pore-forming ESAT-6 family protein [Eubacteriales bacterium]|nr:pore-forming ESAT-6 family protein [Eubacteriales bacterium]